MDENHMQMCYASKRVIFVNGSYKYAIFIVIFYEMKTSAKLTREKTNNSF